MGWKLGAPGYEPQPVVDVSRLPEHHQQRQLATPLIQLFMLRLVHTIGERPYSLKTGRQHYELCQTVFIHSQALSDFSDRTAAPISEQHGTPLRPIHS